MSSNDMSSNYMSSNDMSSNYMSGAKAAAALELAPALAVIGKVILRAQDLRELSWQPATRSYGLSHYEVAMEVAAQLIKVEDSNQEQVISEVAELVSMLNFVAWNDAQLLAERLTALEGSNSEGIVPLGAESP